MYHTFFNLTEPAFSIAVNPRYLYMSQQHKEALAHLLYGVGGGGFVMLTGEVGTGKTTIIRCLLEQMPEDTDIAIVMNPMSNVPELLTTICEELDADYISDDPTVKDLTDSIHHFLLRNHTLGRNTVLLIDEAQLLSAQALEQVRLLTNLETNTQKLLHIVLVGQPELKKILSQPELRQLAQRITARFHLVPLSLEETQAYIYHRLKVAGLPDGKRPFPDAIIKRIHSFTGGIPRLVNVICERCLIGAYASSKQEVDNAIFNIARKEVIGGLGEHHHVQSTQLRISVIAVATVILLAGLFSAIYLIQDFRGKHGTTSKASSSVALSSSNASSSQLSMSSAASSSASSSVATTHMHNYSTAEDHLFNYLGLPLAPETRPCGKNTQAIMECEKAKLHTWTEVATIDRPAILVLATPEKFSVYLVLIGLSQDKALVLNEQQQQVALPLEKIGREWTGEIYYLWKKPRDFAEPLNLGDSSATVEWIAQQFAKLDKQKEPLTNDLFSLALQERIKMFQRTKGLPADGVINQQTLMKINEALAIDKTLLTDF